MSDHIEHFPIQFNGNKSLGLGVSKAKEGAPVLLRKMDDKPESHWILDPKTGLISSAANPDLYLDVAGPQAVQGAPLILAKRNQSRPSQAWNWTKDRPYISNGANSKLKIDNPHGLQVPGNKIQLFEAAAEPQSWFIPQDVKDQTVKLHLDLLKSEAERKAFTSNPVAYLKGRGFHLSAKEQTSQMIENYVKAVTHSVKLHPHGPKEFPLPDLSSLPATVENQLYAVDPYIQAEAGWLGVYVTLSDQATNDWAVNASALVAAAAAAVGLLFPPSAAIAAIIAVFFAFQAAYYTILNTNKKGIVVLFLWAGGTTIAWPR